MSIVSFAKISLDRISLLFETNPGLCNSFTARFATVTNLSEPIARQIAPHSAAAISLYTASWTIEQDSLYYKLNACLRSEERQLLKPYFPYLRLLLCGLESLPRSDAPSLWRGVSGAACDYWSVCSCFFFSEAFSLSEDVFDFVF